MNLKFWRTDNGNCRVYYREGRKLRCFQEDRPGQFTLNTCSRDGEPDSEIKPAELQIDGLPTDDSSTARAFCIWWEANAPKHVATF